MTTDFEKLFMMGVPFPGAMGFTVFIDAVTQAVNASSFTDHVSGECFDQSLTVFVRPPYDYAEDNAEWMVKNFFELQAEVRRRLLTPYWVN